MCSEQPKATVATGEASPPPSREERAAREVVRRLQQARFESYWAGGAVRDRLLGHAPKDFDVATAALPKDVHALFPDAHDIGAHFGVVLVHQDRVPVEVATFRIDGDYSDGRRPDEVTFATAQEDAERRDFTVNGLFFDPIEDRLIDHVGGQADLETATLRAIGEPRTRFAEDKLRLLRAVRFATTLGFEIEPGTWTALQEVAHEIGAVSPERIAGELDRMFLHRDRLRAFDLLSASGLLSAIVPEIDELRGCEQPPEWHPEGDVFVHTRLLLTHLPEEASLELVWAALLHDIAKPETRTVDETGRVRFNGHDHRGAEMAREILERLRYSNRVIDAVAEMVARHMHFINVPKMRKATLRRFMARPTFSDEMHLHYADCSSSHGMLDIHEHLAQKREEFANEPLIPDPLLGGRDLLELGWSPGPEIGRALKAIQTEQLDGALSTREDALRWLEESFQPSREDVGERS